MAEVVVSPKGHIGKNGIASTLRHFGTGALAAVVVPLIGTLAPVVDGLSRGDWEPLLALKLSKLGAIALGGLAGGGLAGLYRLIQRRAAELKMEIPAVNRPGEA